MKGSNLFNSVQGLFLFFVFKVLNGLAPSYLSDLLSLHSPGRCLRSLNQKLLLFPRSRLKKKGDRAFAIAGPKLWNSLPVSIGAFPLHGTVRYGSVWVGCISTAV